MEIKVELSNHHVHLGKEDILKLFGQPLTMAKNLGSEWASQETVEVIGPKGSFRCRVICSDYRDVLQAEVLRSDNYLLGIDAPVAKSGTKRGLDSDKPLAKVIIRGSVGEIEGEFAMVAARHIHIGGKYYKGTVLEGRERCKLRFGGVRGCVFENVLVEAYPDYDVPPVIHFDTEEGNAAMLKNGDLMEVIVD